MTHRLHDGLEALAHRQRVSPTKLGTDAGLSDDTINRWIRESKKGKRPGNMDKLAQLARHYSVTVESLIAGEPRPVEQLQTAGDELEPVREEAATLLVRRGYGIKESMRAVSGALEFKRGSEVPSAEQLATLGEALLAAEHGKDVTRPAADSMFERPRRKR